MVSQQPKVDPIGFSKGRVVGFLEGMKYLVTVCEEEMATSVGTTRSQLLETGKLPVYWVTTLTKCLGGQCGLDRPGQPLVEPAPVKPKKQQDGRFGKLKESSPYAKQRGH